MSIHRLPAACDRACGCPKLATLRDLHVFVDGSAESVAPDDLDIGGVGGIGLGECS